MNMTRLITLIGFVSMAAGGFVRGAISEELGKKLFDPEISAADLEKVVAEAAKAGVPLQTLAEAKLAWGLQHQDNAFLEKNIADFEAAAKNFKKEDSAGMGSQEDFLALLSYIKALGSLKNNDEDGFKKNIMEAFWLSPEQGQLFGQAILNRRMEQKMAKVQLDLKLKLTTSKGEATTLEAQLGKNKALLLDFWASWCGPCMQLMPELPKKAALLKKHGIAVAGMNTEGSEATAEKVRGEKKIALPWLVEPKGEPFSGPLGIDSIPRMVLISTEGKILFNGHPEDPALWVALKKVDATIEEPKTPE